MNPSRPNPLYEHVCRAAIYTYALDHLVQTDSHQTGELGSSRVLKKWKRKAHQLIPITADFKFGEVLPPRHPSRPVIIQAQAQCTTTGKKIPTFTVRFIYYNNCTQISHSVTITQQQLQYEDMKPLQNPITANISVDVVNKGFQKKKHKHLQHSASDPCTSSKIFSTITNVWATKSIQNGTIPFKINRLQFFQHTAPSDHHFLPLLPMLTLRLRARTCNSSRYWPSQRAQVDKIAPLATRIENYGITPFQFVIIVAKLQRLLSVTTSLFG